MYIRLNKKIPILKNVINSSLMAIGVAASIFLSSSQAFAQTVPAPAPAPAASGSFSQDIKKCDPTTDPNCIPSSPDTALNSDLKDCAPGVHSCNIVTKYLNPFIKVLSVTAGIAVVIGIVYGGIQYSSSGGDPQKVAVAKRHIMQSIIALLIFFFLYAFLKFIIPGSILVG